MTLAGGAVVERRRPGIAAVPGGVLRCRLPLDGNVLEALHKELQEGHDSAFPWLCKEVKEHLDLLEGCL